MMVKYWSEDGTKFHEYYGHKGGPSLGVNTLLAANKNNGNITIVLSNLQTTKPEDVFYQIQEAIFLEAENTEFKLKNEKIQSISK